MGVNVAIKDHQVLYATENRSLKDNRRLLMVPGFRSKKSSDANAPALSVFPGSLSLGSQPAKSFDNVLPQSDHPLSSITPAVVDTQLPTGGVGIHQQTAVVASSMSAAPFAASRNDGGDGDGDDDNSSSYHKASDYGTEDNHSESSSVHSDYDNSKASDDPLLDTFANFSYRDGHHSDLFEILFQTLPVDDNKYRSPGTTLNGVSGPLLFPPCDYPPAVPTLLAHVDDGVFLPQELQDSTFEQRTRLLYLNWNVLHGVDAVHDIKRWLESLSKEDHLLLIHLYAAYWVTAPVVTLTFGRAKAQFWDAVNHAGAFVNGLFVITHDVPLVSVTVESLLVRTVSQWVQFLGCLA